MTTQRKLYESRCRQIIHEKNQLDKTQKEALEQKHILENENKRFRMILHTIKGKKIFLYFISFVRVFVF